MRHQRSYSSLYWKLAPVAAALAALLAATAAAAYAVGWWLDYSDEPGKADILVCLAGDFFRPLYAADLFRRGYAREIWLSSPYRAPSELMVDGLGIRLPREEEIDRQILLRRGVPAGKIHIYGKGVMSTVNEAIALKAALDLRGKSILVVTSRWHARRARWIFRRELKGTGVRVVATPYEPFSRLWWKEQALARSAVLEVAKMIYYWTGGRFMTPLENTPHVF